MKKSKVILGFTALIIGCFLGVLDSTIVNIALPDMAIYLGKSINDVSWITTAYLLSFSVFLIIGSKIADQFGRKKILIIGLFIFGLSSLLCGVGNSFAFYQLAYFYLLKLRLKNQCYHLIYSRKVPLRPLAFYICRQALQQLRNFYY